MQVAGSDCCYLDGDSKKLVGRPMHVWLESNVIGLLDSLDASRVRTLILQSYNGDLSDISNFKNLRVLMLLDSTLSKLSSSIGILIHLRYLKLSHCKIVGGLSKFISNPACLQTLILKDNVNVELSTKDFSKLINLRQLEIYGWDSSEFSEEKMAAGFGKFCMRGSNDGMIHSRWLSSLTNIVQISLIKCRGVEYLPPLERLPFLKSLYIYQLDSLRYIRYEEPILPEIFYPALECLRLWDCYSLDGWIGLQSPHFSFPRLSHLEIGRCGSLYRMPTFPNLEKRLELNDKRVNILEATLYNLRVKADDSHHLSLPPLSRLKSLHIAGGSLDVKNISKDWLQNLTSLEHLKFERFPSQDFREIETWFNDDPNCLPSLQKITFYYCRYLEALPDWMCNLSSLQHIVVEDCRGLTSLPEGMSRLTNLMTLEIIDCPLIFEEFQTQTGATQSKVAHIPNIILK